MKDEAKAIFDEEGEHYRGYGDVTLEHDGTVRVDTCWVRGSSRCSVAVAACIGGVQVRLGLDAAGAGQLQSVLEKAARIAGEVDCLKATEAQGRAEGGAQ